MQNCCVTLLFSFLILIGLPIIQADLVLAAEIADKASGTTLHKLQRAAFAQDHFSIMLPPGYETKVQSGAERAATYTVDDYPHGTYEVACTTAPEHSAFSPLLLKKTVETRKDIKKIDNSQPIKVGDLAGTAWDVTLQAPGPHDSAKIIGFTAGRRMYVLTASGTKPWLESAAVKQFLNSFELISD